jgi:hypothetical protein
MRKDGKEGVFELVSSVPDMPNITPPPDKLTELQAVNAELLAACVESRGIVAEYIRLAGPCDHSVDICVCGLKSTLASMDAAIAKAKGQP